MTSRIHLVRHGVSAHIHDGSWVDAVGAQRFIEKYDAAGIREGAPPSDVVEAASKANALAASTLPRAIESIGKLAPGGHARRLSSLPVGDPRRPRMDA